MANPKKKTDKPRGTPRWAIIAILAFVFLCVVPVCVITGLSLLGPEVGEVFEEVQQTIEAGQTSSPVPRPTRPPATDAPTFYDGGAEHILPSRAKVIGET